MTEKLVKTGNDYILYSKDKTVLGITSGTMEGRMLSLKNCQAIDNGYDLDEVVEDIVKTIVPNDRGEDIWYGTSMAVGKLCFQKALEILSDKKFSEEDVKFMFQLGFNLDNAISRNEYNAHIQSLQQTEWDVRIEMECVMGCQNLILNGENSVCCGDKKPKLDEDGCLILKRK